MPGANSFATCSGAAVNVWVSASTEQQALRIASLQDAGWRIESLEAVFPVTRDDYGEDTTGLEYYEQAMLDGIVLVFHTWQDGAQH